QTGRGLSGRVFVCNGPTRRFRSAAEILLKRDPVDLDYDSVYLIVELVALLRPIAAELQNVFNRLAGPTVLIHLESGFTQPLKHLPMGVERFSAVEVEIVDEAIELARSDRLRVE